MHVLGLCVTFGEPAFLGHTVYRIASESRNLSRTYTYHVCMYTRLVHALRFVSAFMLRSCEFSSFSNRGLS